MSLSEVNVAEVKKFHEKYNLQMDAETLEFPEQKLRGNLEDQERIEKLISLAEKKDFSSPEYGKELSILKYLLDYSS